MCFNTRRATTRDYTAYILYDADQRIKAWHNFFDADLVFPSGFVFCTFLVFKTECVLKYCEFLMRLQFLRTFTFQNFQNNSV